jgi:hypothetical protein
MTRVGLFFIGVLFSVAYLTYVLVTPSLGTPSQVALGAFGRLAITVLQTAPVLWLAVRRVEYWRWSQLCISLLASVCALLIISAYSAVPIYGLALWGWSSVALAGVLAAIVPNAWWSALAGFILPPSIMALDMTLMNFGVYGNLNFTT